MATEKTFKCRLHGEDLGMLTLSQIDKLPQKDREAVEAEVSPGEWARPARWQGADDDIEVVL